MARRKLANHLFTDEHLSELEQQLPTWAQGELQRLRAALRAREEQITGSVGASDTFLTDYTYDDLPLGISPYIAFGIKKDQRFKVRVVAEGVLEIRGPNGPVFVRPVAGNLFQVHTERNFHGVESTEED